MALFLRYFFPFIDGSSAEWSTLARTLRWLTLFWALVGLLVLFSASYPVAEADFGDGWYYFKRQLIWLFVGLIIFNKVIHTSLRDILGVTPWCLFGLLLCIGLTLMPGLGTSINGATRWIYIGPVPFQPSELIKPFLILQGACIFSQWSRLRWKTRFTWLGIFGAVVGMILLQPNLSTASLCGMLLWFIALSSGISYVQLFSTALGGFVVGVVSISQNEYQWLRISSFLDPWAVAQEDGYQLVQSLMAIGSGGVWGTGFGLSHQKLFYLPIQHTDFIFAVFAEEFGLVGGICLLLFLVIYATLGLLVASQATRNVYKLVAIGTIVLLMGQSLINIGVATGALPTTGLPLPLFSYGGNSMLSSLMTAGLLVRVARETHRAEVVSLPGILEDDEDGILG
ncbi:FtsW/RodA/SpoVE family cell cycle protein [Prochlorothrix hollandica]|uniref:FtsW/RodA/SpoVE family cell cycle protein n=1 Tax=Prochlorothrix hollandica TaxID=1223 RepID=UPI003340CF2F